jgi:Protein of unknown function (DUF1232)
MRPPSTPVGRRPTRRLLSSPIDLIPDFIPVLGYLDDAVIVALMLRWLTRDCGTRALEQHWPGPASSLGIVLSLAGIRNPDGQPPEAH